MRPIFMGGLMRVDKCDVAHSEATEHGREIAFSEGLQAFRRLGTAGYHDVNLLPRDQANMAVMIVAEGSTRTIHIFYPRLHRRGNRCGIDWTGENDEISPLNPFTDPS